MPQLPVELLNSIGVVLEVLVAVTAALIVAFWIGMVLWTLRDIRSRTRDFFAWILAGLLVLAAGPIGLLLYLLLRPRETLAQVYDRQLEEEALLRDITARRACPSCQTVTEPDWLVCPRCRAELRRTCAACGRPLELDWVICPYCVTPVGEARPTVAGVMPEGEKPEETLSAAPTELRAPVLPVARDSGTNGDLSHGDEMLPQDARPERVPLPRGPVSDSAGE